MGKQKGQSNRTKGNVRPSSSGRAANFLSQPESFVGFESFSGDLGYIPLLKSVEDDKDCLIDPNFKVALVKLSKKDLTTKLKALSEFSELCHQGNASTALTALPYWPRIYNRLSEDNDNRVREAAAVALHSLIKAVGKEIAPHLKSIMGCWWIAQNDSYSPAATASMKAFTAAFPTSEKQAKAVNFCQDQVLDVLFRQLLTDSSVQSPGVSTVFDGDKNVERRISCSLSAFALFITTLHNNSSEIHQAMISKLLERPRFWKFGKHKSPDIRAAFYCVISSLCTAIPDLLKDNRQIALKSILCRLNEANPIVSQCLWEAADRLTMEFSDWGELVDLRKVFLPQLWSMLKSGFHGNAQLVCPFVLPLLSRLPNTLAVFPVYQEFFECFQTGMIAEVVKDSARESRAAVTAYAECIQYIIRKSVKSRDVPDWETTDFVVNQQLLPLLQNSILHAPCYGHVVSPLHQLLARTLASFAEKSKKSTGERFLRICSIMWKYITNLGCMIAGFANDEENSVEFDNACALYISFLAAVKSACYVGQTKNVRVKFNDTAVNKKADQVVFNEVLLDSLENCVKSFINCVLELKLQPCHKLNVISTILLNFSSQSLFEKVVADEKFLSSSKCRENASLYFLLEVIEPFFEHVVQTENILLNSRSFGACLFACLQFCSDAAPQYMETFFEKQSDKCVEACAAIGEILLEHTELLQNWLRSENCTFAQFLTLLGSKISASERKGCCQFGKVIRLALTAPYPNNDCDGPFIPLFHEKAACSVVNEICKALESQTNNSRFVLGCSQLLFDIWSKYFNQPDFVERSSGALLNVGKLLMQCLFLYSDDSLTCLENVVDTVLSAESIDTRENVVCAFQMQFLASCAAEVREAMFSHVDPTTKVAPVASCFAHAFSRSAHPVKFVQGWLESLLPSEEHWLKFHSSVGTRSWVSKDLIVKGHQIALFFNASENFPSALQHFVKSVTCMCKAVEEIMSSASFTSVQNETVRFSSVVGFQSLCLESVFVLSLSDCQLNSEILNILRLWAGNYPDLFKSILDTISEKSTTTGGGWHACLREVLKFFERTVIDHRLMVLKLEEPRLGEEVVNTMLVYLDACASFSCVEAIVEWSAAFLLQSDCIAADETRKDPTVPFAMCLFVYALEKMRLLRESGTAREHTEAVLQFVMTWRNVAPDLFLFDCDLQGCNENQLLLNIGIVRFLIHVVRTNVSIITKEGWDFFQCSAVSWLESACITMEKSRAAPFCVFPLLHAACLLARALGAFLTSPDAVEDPTLPSSLTTEWKEFFEPAAHADLVTLFVLTHSVQDASINCVYTAMRHCTLSITSATLLSASSRLQPYLYPGSDLRHDVQTLLHHLTRPMIEAKTGNNAIKLSLAYAFLTKVVEKLFVTDTDLKLSQTCVPPSFTDVLSLVEDSVIQACTSLREDLSTENIETEECSDEEEPDFTENDTGEQFQQSRLRSVFAKELPAISDVHFPSILSYLLIWRLIIGSAKHIQDDARSEYVSGLGKNSLTDISRLLTNLWHLMPGAPLLKQTADLPSKASKGTMFDCEPDLQVGSFDHSTLQHLACAVYMDLLRSMPVLMRAWYNDLSKTARAKVDSYTTKHVSPVLCREELKSISQTKPRQGMTVKARFAAREVIARYEVAEASFEISVQFSPNHPLTPVQVNTLRRAGVGAAQWRYWILQMTMMLQHQNGSVADALLLWKQKVDKRLDGLEECMICFSIVHGSNAQSLPKLECKTCHKKYHAECLYKWFDTSNQSTCPLCRAPMMFR